MGELNVATVTRRPEILLVDSQEVILQRLQQLLSPLPYTLHFARDATQALQLLASREVDLVISAAHLPQMDGPTLLARIHQQYPSTTRILLTGDPDLKLIAKAINEGEIYRYLSKPWDDQELLLALRQALEHQHSERERLRLQDLAQQQNAELKALNTLLEKRVSFAEVALGSGNRSITLQGITVEPFGSTRIALPDMQGITPDQAVVHYQVATDSGETLSGSARIQD